MAMIDEKFVSMDAAQRAKALVECIIKNKEIWVLTDDDGCVMLSTEDEDGVPVWPSHTMAEAWATEEWEQCRPESISLRDFNERWIAGLTSDDLCIMLCPLPGEEGEVVSPDEFVKLMAKHG